MSIYIEDDATHIARPITSLPDGVCGVESKYLEKHAQMSRYGIYSLEDRNTGDLVYGILMQDHAQFWGTKKGAKTIALTLDNEIVVFADIDKKMLDYAQAATPSSTENGVRTYFMQRMMFPDNEDIPTRPKKKLEYEAAYQLWVNLGDTMYFTHQQNILNYHADMILELKSTIDLDIPSIGVEIDEDDHGGYDKKKEKERKEVIEYFDNVLYRIPIKRTASLEDIKKTVADTAKLIMDKVNDMLINYNPSVSQEEIEKELLKHNYANHLVTHFTANHNTGDKMHCLRHDVVAEALGYGKFKNFAKFRQVLTKYFVIGIDYKEVRLFDIDGLDPRGSNPSQRDILGRKNNGNKEVQTKILIFSRSTFHRI